MTVDLRGGERRLAPRPARATRCRGARLLRALVFAAFATAASFPPAQADARAQVAALGCEALTRAVRALPGGGPGLLRSYPVLDGAEDDVSALRDAAFVYDNALAAVALISCGDTASARRIADALAVAAGHDRFYRDGRIRNAYRAGPVAPDAPPALPGWWDAGAGRWNEDAYQAGTATGNVAWVALALLAAADATGERRYRDGAASLMGWVQAHAWDAGAPAGFIGGYFGHEPAPMRQGWKSTEHNLDAAAAFAWLARGGDGRWTHLHAAARAFTAAMWDAGRGRFLIGTGADGETPNAGPSALDAQLWPLLAFPDAPVQWRRVLEWVQAAHAVGGGYGFKDHPDGLWTEGTAQAALTFAAAGRVDEADRLFGPLLAQRSPGGFLYATPERRIRTGLSVGPFSTTDDFYYFHLPHLGATAWAVLAAQRWNPFTGRRLDAGRHKGPPPPTAARP